MIHIDVLGSSAIILSLVILISFVNYHFLRLHTTIAMMAAALIISLIIAILNHVGLHHLHHEIHLFVNQINFHTLVMNFMLGLLLFAGALTINLKLLKAQRWEIGILAFISTIISAFLIGVVLYWLFTWFHVHINFAYCILFGSLISPTDPIAVLAIFKQVNAPKPLETAVAAESLFNDGVGVVLFITAYQVAYSTGNVHASDVILLFLRDAIGGIIYGLLFGYILCMLLNTLRDLKLEIMLSIILVFGAYSLAQRLMISGPLAMVTAGIFVANFKRDSILLPLSRHYLELIWEMIDELLNMVLFLLLGFEVLVIDYNWQKVFISACVIVLVLFARFVTVAIPMTIMRPWREHVPHTISTLTWGGLRGGLAVALALSLPHGEVRSWLLALTYAVVLFSILIQGTTVKFLVRLTRESSK